MLEDDVGQLVEQPHQPRGKGIGRPGGDLPVSDMGEPVANGGDDAPAGAVEAGIDAEDDHAALFSDRVGALRIWRAKLASSDRFIPPPQAPPLKIGKASLRERVCQYVKSSVGTRYIKKKK